MAQSALDSPERPPTDMIGAMFGFGGRISRRRYLVGLLVAMAVLLGAITAAGGAMSPTGGGAPLLAIPLLAIFVWMFLSLAIQRLRDAGRSRALVILQFVALGLVIYPGIEFIESLWPLLLAALVAALTFPAFLSQSAGPATVASQDV